MNNCDDTHADEKNMSTSCQHESKLGFCKIRRDMYTHIVQEEKPDHKFNSVSHAEDKISVGDLQIACQHSHPVHTVVLQSVGCDILQQSQYVVVKVQSHNSLDSCGSPTKKHGYESLRLILSVNSRAFSPQL